MSGGGTLVLAASNTYTGATTVNSISTLQIGNGGAAGTFGSGSVTNSGALVFNRSDAALVASNTISGTGSLYQAGAGMTTLNGTLNYTGSTIVNNGVLNLSGAGVTSLASPSIAINSGGTLALNVPSGTTNSNVLARPTPSPGPACCRKTGTGTLFIGYGGGGNQENRVSLSAGGVFDVQAGDLNIGWVSDSFTANHGGLNLASGATFHNSQSGGMQFDWLTGSGSLNNAFNNSTPTLTVGTDNTTNNAAYGVLNNTATFSGVIGYPETYNGVSVNSLNLVKTGSGTQVLAGQNGYTGTTTISGGVLSRDHDFRHGGQRAGQGWRSGPQRRHAAIQRRGRRQQHADLQRQQHGPRQRHRPPQRRADPHRDRFRLLFQHACASYSVAKTGAGTLTLGGGSDNSYLNLNVFAGTLVLAKSSSSNVHALGGIAGVALRRHRADCRHRRRPDLRQRRHRRLRRA